MELLRDFHLEVTTCQAGRCIIRFGSSKSGWTTHTHTSRHGLDVPRRRKCYIPRDKSTVNSAEEQRARTFPYVLSHKANCFRINKTLAEACGSRMYFSPILQVL